MSMWRLAEIAERCICLDVMLVVDILEPHSPSLTDSYAKAKGLAQFAAKHAMAFGRIEVIRLVGKVIHRLDLMDATNRKRVLAVDTNSGLDLIFGIAI